MIGRLLFLAVIPAAAFAQLQLFTFDGTIEKPATGVTDLGQVAAGDSQDVRIRVRNTGTSALALQTLTLAGQGFVLTSAPSLPFVIAPTNFAEVRVRFSAAGVGAYSANLQINSLQTMLHVIVVATATVSMSGTALSSGANIDFGRVQKGKLSTRLIQISNATSGALAVPACGISGAAFQAPELRCPLSLSPGDAVTVTINFTPPVASVQTGSLTLGSRAFALSGTGFDPPLPKPSIAFDSSLESGAQQRLSIRLASAAQSSGNGTVTLAFQPAATGFPDDSAIQFISTGARTLSFQVRDGDQAAVFPSGVDTVFQTGTTAGTLIFRVQLESYDESFSFPIAPAAISIDHASANRRVNDLDVSLTAFDNTRGAGRFSFTFYDSGGRIIQPGAVRADWSEMFSGYFKTSRTGGSFTMRATFPVSGDASQIAGVEVEMTNTAGNSRTARLTF